MITCNKCNKELKIENSEPITLSGWYGNTRFVWDFIGTVKLPVAKEIKCKCGHRQKYEEYNKEEN